MASSLPAADRAWLVGLDDRLWESHVATHPCSHGRRYSTEKPGAKIAREEWERIVALVAEHELPTTLSNAAFCFGLALSIWDHTTPPDKPAYLTGISGAHLPDYQYPRDRNGFDLGWARFHPIASSARNAELLGFYGMPPVEEKSRYAY